MQSTKMCTTRYFCENSKFMRLVPKISILLLFTFAASTVFSQSFTQSLRGRIVDETTQAPLTGVVIEVAKDSFKKGAITDQNGDFRLTKLPIGRYNLQASFIGYETKRVYQLELTSSKEVIINLSMKEEITSSSTVLIIARKDKSKTNNQMISVSGRTFSIEESQRYAGSRGDVARMAQNFAGVQGADDSRNDIIVRGNSPTGVLYRMEGVDIPNPNHFSSAGTTGGPVSMLNNNVLENSDFISGAFPAEYGNATAAVFDIGLRKGNDEQFEFLGQMGFAGLELMAEGPLSSKSKASFLVNYRYSALGFFSLIGIQFGTGTAIPKYQDMSFHLHFPDKKGHTKLFGLGGVSNIELFQSREEEQQDNLYAGDLEDLAYGTNTGVIGITRFHQLSKNTFAKLTLAVDASQTQTHIDTFALDANKNKVNFGGFFRENSSQGKYSANALIQHRFSAQNILKGGLRINNYFFSLADSFYNTARIPATNQQIGWVQPKNFDGTTSLVQAYASQILRWNNRISTTWGFNIARFSLNKSTSFEPRLGISYKINNRYSLSGGYGLHSQLPSFQIYFERKTNSLGVQEENKNQALGFTKSHHIVVSHDFRIGKNTRLKLESYAQFLFDVPIDAGSDTFYSLLNEGTDFGISYPDRLVNEGKGRNYGVELTLERFLNKGFYFLNTLSFYRSQYEDKTGTLHPTVFDSRYALNVLGGKEFYFKEISNKKGVVGKGSLTTDIKFTINGGKRYTPIDITQSQLNREVVLDNSRRNNEQFKDYIRLDFRIAYKLQMKNSTHEWGVDIQNLTNRKNIFNRTYFPETNEYRITYQTGIFPIALYRVTF